MGTRQAIALLALEEDKLRLLTEQVSKLRRTLTAQMHIAAPHRLSVDSHVLRNTHRPTRKPN